VRQYTELLATEKVELVFTEGAIRALAAVAAEINGSAENIGARRLHTVMEKLLEDVSFDAPDRAGEAHRVTEEMVHDKLDALVKDRDLARYIL
jgi:ATP-dependent HslUV protease ATP-binding subunit HslU